MATKPVSKIAIVGSGPSGVHAAATLVELGHEVTLLDVGLEAQEPTQVPDQAFTELRRTDPNQGEYFLGKRFEGLPLGPLRAGSGLTAPRSFVTERVDALTPTRSEGFSPVQSLARGGLGGAWGLGCFVMSDAELTAMGLPTRELGSAYQRVSDRIGISGDSGDAGSAPYLGKLQGLLPPLEVDEPSERMLARYGRGDLFTRGYRLGRTALALLSHDHAGRGGSRYHDMDFWSDHGESAWRPPVLLRQLLPKLKYQAKHLVLRFEETASGVRVHGLKLFEKNEPFTETFDKLLLCAGALGTARIVLRSRPKSGTPLPLLSNPYRYALCLQPSLLGRPLRDRRHSMGQLVLSFDAAGDGLRVPIASLLSYRSLLLWRLVKEAPLAVREARQILQWLAPAFTIAGLFIPQFEPAAELELEPDTASPSGDRLVIRQRSEPSLEGLEPLLRGLRSLGALPLRVVNPGEGASIHYGGTLPFAGEAGPLQTDSATGGLGGSSRVFVADGSPFKMLPGKGITLTLMAYADWVARRATQA